MELSNIDLAYIHKAFNQQGWVYDFNYDTFIQFTVNSIGENLLAKYNLSKGKSLDAFFSDKTVDIEKKIKLLSDLIEYDNVYRIKNINEIKDETLNKQKQIIQECKKILNKLNNAILTINSDNINEKGLKELIEIAQNYYKIDKKIALEKIWDAYDRLKSYFDDSPNGKHKDKSVEKIIDIISNSNENYKEFFNNEFKILTEFGNNYQIRHFEINKIKIDDINYIEYLYNKCLILINLALKYIQ